jgi:hypothetical protein
VKVAFGQLPGLAAGNACAIRRDVFFVYAEMAIARG